MNEDCQLESRCFRGQHPGPRLLITAGIHRDESLPMLAVSVCNPAPASGFPTPKVTLGQHVCCADLLAEIHSEIGGHQHCVVSQQEGKVVVLRESPRLNQGDAVAVIAESNEAS